MPAANPYGAILAGAGQGIMALNDYMTSQDIDKAMRLAIANRGRIQGQIDERLMGEIGDLRALNPEEERAAAMSDFMSRLRAARATNVGSMGARGAVSDREAQALQATQATLGEFAGREADIDSRLDAARRLREKEALGASRAQSDIGLLKNRMSSQDFLDQLRIQRKSRKNPWMDMLGEGLKGAGMAIGGGGFGGGGSTAGIGQHAGANFNPNMYGGGD